MRIGELAATTGTTTKTLRFYEAAGLLPPPQRTSAGYRTYDPAVTERLDFIQRSQRAGLTLAQIREVLAIRDGGNAPCSHVQHLLGDRLADLDRQLADLTALRATVAALLDQADTVAPDACPPATVCRYL
ncbi:DNA-binding transcriptional MerR regulator [Blastococcus colisei]|uniref:DNA-binding transcriptional MerR regulator n=1 Tax=Blastococcus colisei TaxID=1564162 RepID=A0A543PGB3_9ACTN|nr:heavy metal-responsive transcriptional regulator [Blastococcus colisei]TQN43122.1 DNA-binding transcriptional MerR regulator [Blastococcus colisei]